MKRKERLSKTYEQLVRPGPLFFSASKDCSRVGTLEGSYTAVMQRCWSCELYISDQTMQLSKEPLSFFQSVPPLTWGRTKDTNLNFSVSISLRWMLSTFLVYVNLIIFLEEKQIVVSNICYMFSLSLCHFCSRSIITDTYLSIFKHK